MTNVGILRIVLVLAVSAIVPALAQGDPAAVSRVESLIKDLGSESFQAREQAEAAILKMSSAVTIPSLSKHLDAPDLEIAERVARLVPFLRRRIRVMLRASKESYGVNEPVKLTVRFRNEGVVKIWVRSVTLRHLRGLLVTDRNGMPVQWNPPSRNSRRSNNHGLVPGREVSMTVAVPAMNRFGTYRLRLRWGDYISNEVAVKVVAPNGKPPVDLLTPRLRRAARIRLTMAVGTTAPTATASVAKLESLIKDFSSESFKTRERAETAIRKIKPAVAVPVLRKHLNSSDPETVDRVVGIIRYLERMTLVSLRASKDVYERGEPIDLIVTFENKGVVETVRDSSGLHQLLGLVATDSVGNPVESIQSNFGGLWGGVDVKLAPGQKYSVRIKAINFFMHPKTHVRLRQDGLRMDRPGTYYLRLYWDVYASNGVAVTVN